MTDAELATALHALAQKLTMWLCRADVSTHEGTTFATIVGYTRNSDTIGTHHLHITAHALLRQHRTRYQLLIMRGSP